MIVRTTKLMKKMQLYYLKAILGTVQRVIGTESLRKFPRRNLKKILNNSGEAGVRRMTSHVISI